MSAGLAASRTAAAAVLAAYCDGPATASPDALSLSASRLATALGQLLAALPQDAPEAEISTVSGDFGDDGEDTGPAMTQQQERPVWFTAPCPAWCAYGHDHLEWAFDDRRHRSEDSDVTLTVMDAIVDEVEGKAVIVPRVISVSLDQHYREAEPRVCVAHGDEADAAAYLTLDEAEQHARHLLSLVATARVGACAALRQRESQ